VTKDVEREDMPMDGRGILIVVSGFSGSGKGTIMKEIMNRYDNYALSVSATTRKPRPGEEDGREYFFRSTEEFEKMIAKDELIEYARYVDNYYGTPRAYVEEQLEAGKDVILEIEIQGALKVKEKFPDTLLLFVTPPTAAELRERLVGRGTETMDVIDFRMKRAKEEAEGMGRYDYLIINDVLDECVKEMHQIIQGEHRRSFRNETFIERMQEELKGE
jgi:guanylate kinase